MFSCSHRIPQGQDTSGSELVILTHSDPVIVIDALIHGEEAIVLGDRTYTRNDCNLEAQRQPEEPVWGMPFKRKSGEELPAEHAVLNRMLVSNCVS